MTAPSGSLAIRHRGPGRPTDGVRRLRLTDRVVDLDRCRVVVGDQNVSLTRKELELLTFLALHPGRTFTIEDLLGQVWAYHPQVVSRTVSTTVHRLRRKLEADPRNPRHLVNTYGSGYRLELHRHEPLPSALGDFFGRAADLDRLEALLDAARLITLVGVGGVGKSRCALELAQRVAGELPARAPLRR